jgi:hypothetical protein
VLCSRQLGPSTVSRKCDQILRDHRDRAPCALLPRCVRGRIDHNLTHDAPAGVVGITASNEKPCKRVGDALSIGIGRMDVKVPERVADLATVIHGSRELASRPARSVLLFLDPSTVLTMSRSARDYACIVDLPRFLKSRAPKEDPVLIGDPRVEGWESVGMFEDRATAVAWRDQLLLMGVDACCVADHPLDRAGRGDIFLVVPPEQWSQATEIVDNL